MINYQLFIDDLREPTYIGMPHLTTSLREFYQKNEWIIVRNYNEFINYIKNNGLPTLISFDCDLQDIHYKIGAKHDFEKFNISDYESEGVEKTGVHCAQFLIDYCLDNNLKLPEYLIHSQNPAGSLEIKSRLERFKKYQLTGL